MYYICAITSTDIMKSPGRLPEGKRKQKEAS